MNVSDKQIALYDLFWCMLNENPELDENLLVDFFCKNQKMAKGCFLILLNEVQHHKELMNSKLCQLNSSTFYGNITSNIYEPTNDSLNISFLYQDGYTVQNFENDVLKLTSYVFKEVFTVETLFVTAFDKYGKKINDKKTEKKDFS